MQVKVRKLSETHQAELTITNTPEEVERAYQITYKKAQKKVHVPGFRKGKSPLDVLERHLGYTFLNDVMEALAIESLRECMDGLDPPAASLPVMKVKNFQRHKGATLAGVYDCCAELQLGAYKKVEISEPTPIIDDIAVETTLNRMRKAKGVLLPREDGAEMEDHLKINITIRDKEEELYSNDSMDVILGSKSLLPGIDEQIQNMQEEEEKAFSVQIEADFVDPKYAGKELSVQLKLLECRFLELPELDDEFARDQGDFESLEELKNDIRVHHKKQAELTLSNKSRDLIFDKVVNDAKAALPPGMVQKEYDAQVKDLAKHFHEQGAKKTLDIQELARLTGEDAVKLEEELRKKSEDMLKQHLILVELADTLSLNNVKREEMMDYLNENEYADGILDSTMKQLSEAERDRLVRFRFQRKKVLDWLYEQASVNRSEEVSLTELHKNGLFS